MGVPRIIDEGLRLSYLLWEEARVPILVLEVVSQTPRKEYTQKKQDYAEMGILYYVIYNPLRKRKPRLEAYKLEGGNYQLLEGEPIWLEEIGLGMGKERGIFQGIEREWLYWYDREGKRYLAPEERLKTSETQAREARSQAQQARNQAQQARSQAREARNQAREAQERAKILEAKLRSLGIDPNE